VNKNDKIIITIKDMMEQMDVSDKTIYRMVENDDLPEFTYGFKWSKKKGWHTAVLERHAMEKYEQSNSLKNAGNIGKVRTEDVGVVLLGRGNRGMTQKNTDLDNRDTGKQQLSSKKVTKGVRSSLTNSRFVTGF
jgi:hypothetical protein